MRSWLPLVVVFFTPALPALGLLILFDVVRIFGSHSRCIHDLLADTVVLDTVKLAGLDRAKKSVHSGRRWLPQGAAERWWPWRQPMSSTEACLPYPDSYLPGYGIPPTVVLVSGGVDSTVLLHQLVEGARGARRASLGVLPLFVDYAQRAAQLEYDAVAWQCRRLSLQLTLSLMDDLPKRLLERVQPGLVSRVLLDTKMSFAVRENAARLLKTVAEARPLSEPELTALLQVCGEDKTYLAEVACRALGDLKQLDRARLLLLTQSPRAAPGLVQRWAEVSEQDDLAALERQFEAASSNPKRLNECAFLVKALGRLEGSAASERLSDWYVRIKDQFTALLIAAEWSRRTEATPAAREALRGRVDAPKRLFLSIAAGDPRTEEDAAALMAKRDVKALYGAAYLAGFAKVPGELATPLLWTLASYQHPEVYPLDIGLRARAVTTLVRLAMNKLPAPQEPETLDRSESSGRWPLGKIGRPCAADVWFHLG